MSHNCGLDLPVLFQYYHLWCSVQKWVILFHRFKLKQPSKTHTAFLLQTAHPQSLHREFRMNSTHSDPFFGGHLVIDCICSQSHALSRWRRLQWSVPPLQQTEIEMEEFIDWATLSLCSDLQLCFNIKMRPLNPLVYTMHFLPSSFVASCFHFGREHGRKERTLLSARHRELL